MVARESAEPQYNDCTRAATLTWFSLISYLSTSVTDLDILCQTG